MFNSKENCEWLVPNRDDKVKITLGGKDDIINADDFLTVVRGTILVLKSLNSEARWTIGRASRSSPLNLEIEGNTETLNKFMDGLVSLENDRVSRPEGFSDRALKRTKAITKPLNSGVSSLTYWLGDREPVKISQRIAASVDQLTRSPNYHSYTELEGTLGQIYVHGGRAEFCIYDSLTDEPTTCKFSEADAERVGGLITHRLRVAGKAKYSRETHRPVSIDVEQWEPIGEVAVSLDELHKAGFRVTTGESSEELIRKNRDLDGRKDNLG